MPREVREELGLDRPPRALLAVDWAPHDTEGDKILFLFDCGDLGDEDRIELDGREVDGWEWVDPVQIDQYVVDRLARRLRALGTSPGRYLERGVVTTA